MKNAFATVLLTLLVGVPGLATETRSVYRLTPGWDVGVTGAAAIAAVLPYALASKIIRTRCPCDPSTINGFDRGAVGNASDTALKISDVTLGLSVLGPALADYLLLGISDELLEDAVIYAEALSISAALVSITKHIVQRPLPRVYAGQADLMNEPEGYRSFYSGHATIAFTALSAGAVTANLRYHLGVWPWVAVGALGTTVATARVLGGVHFPSDVVLGAAMGVAVGTIVPWLHRHSSKTASLLISPLSGGAQVTFYKAL